MAAAQGHRTVSRVVGILEHVAARPAGARLGDLAEALGAPRSSVHGFVRGLVAEGYLAEGPERQTYRLGWGAHALLLSQESSLVEATRAVREELLALFDETVTLAVRVGDSVVYLESLTPSHPVCYRAPTRVRRPMWPTSAGKVFLARAPDDVERVLRADAPTAARAEVVAELGEVGERGYARNVGESLTDVAAVAVPLPTGGLPAAVSIAGPVARIRDGLPRIGAVAAGVLQGRDPFADRSSPTVTT